MAPCVRLLLGMGLQLEFNLGTLTALDACFSRYCMDGQRQHDGRDKLGFHGDQA